MESNLIFFNFNIKMKTILSFILLLFLVTGFSSKLNAQDMKTAQSNKELVAKSFENWIARSGTPFDLLADNVQWTIAGSSKQAKAYTSKKQLIEEVLDPLNARLSKRITPEVKGIYADGNMVVVLWKSSAQTNNGHPYNGEYAWFMEFQDGKVIQVKAFLDNQKFAEAMALPKNK